jgi:RNA polymerase sigma-70 factor (ECF subfamily)
MLDIDNLVKRAKKGDGDAFCKLIEPKKDKLYRIAYCYTKNEEDALDIVSEAICKALTSIKSLRNPEFFYTWLTRIVINCSINHTRKANILLHEAGHIPDSVVVKGINEADRLDLYNAIDKLDNKRKSIIILKYIEDLTIVQIAETMNMPIGTVKTYLHKALKELRISLGEVYQ